MFDEVKRRFQDLPKKQVITIGMVIIVFFILLNVNSRLTTLYKKKQDVKVLSTEVVALYATDIVLQTQIISVQDEEMVEKFGRENGYIQPKDVPVAVIAMPGEVGVQEEAIEDAEESKPALQNWELWWYLFFED